jgi:methylenetetrahydrofolate--tRNA-(uracil-5-)-methyltransferase
VQYGRFVDELLAGDQAPLHEFDRTPFFEGCLPIEEMARRGRDTLAFGPMRPVGLPDPRTGRRAHAVVQLRQDNLAAEHYSMVGFQTQLRWPEQKRVFRTIPGLAEAEFVRLGQIHRNTFINAPTHLDAFYRVKSRPALRLAGQITGVEGYLESAATGLAIALYLTLERGGADARTDLAPLPATTALGALARHLTESNPKRFQPANVNYGLFAELGRRLKKAERRAAYAARAHRDLAAWAQGRGLDLDPAPLRGAAAPAADEKEAAPVR